MNLSPETVIVSGDKSTLIMRPVFGEHYTGQGLGPEQVITASDVEETIMWLDEIWANDPKLRESMTEAEWQGFIERVLTIMLY